MRIFRTLAYFSPFLLLAGCTGYNGTQPSYGGSSTSGGQVISAPRTDAGGAVYSGSPSSVAADANRAADIRRAISQDQTLRNTASQVQVTSQNGAITLSGSVPDQSTRDDLIALVRRTPGVARINDQTSVGSTSSTYQSQSTSTYQPQSAPQTQTQGARIYSSPGGTSTTPSTPSGGSATTESGSTTGSAAGASGQIFSMQVDNLTDTDRNLAQQILQGLRTDTSLSNLMPKVNINVSEGRVVLEGHVQNDQQRRTIENIVRRAAANANVENRLQIAQ